ncbi:TetR/AcrR family transcriptional regulator [Furfurilactobacillus cerevisiae]|uniref:TetR/AcrR family transcriptional regulator n=1 Tax=Furfurilactobacillus rossiae TaxID=231049 RepID=UPI003B980218
MASTNNESTNFLAFYTAALQDNSTITPKQRQILAAGLALFSERGFDNTSSADIAERAGVAEGTVYKRFKNKTELMLAVLTPLISSAFPAAANEFETQALTVTYPDLHHFIGTVVENRLKFIQTNFREIKILVGQLLYNKAFSDQIKVIFAKSISTETNAAVKDLQSRHLIVDWPLSYIIGFMVSSVFAYLGKLILNPENDISLKTEIDYTVKFLEKGLQP